MNWKSPKDTTYKEFTNMYKTYKIKKCEAHSPLINPSQRPITLNEVKIWRLGKKRNISSTVWIYDLRYVQIDPKHKTYLREKITDTLSSPLYKNVDYIYIDKNEGIKDIGVCFEFERLVEISKIDGIDCKFSGNFGEKDVHIPVEVFVKYETINDSGKKKMKCDSLNEYTEKLKGK